MLKVHSPLTDAEERVVNKAIGCAIEVHRVLGPGFKEHIYQLVSYLRSTGLKVGLIMNFNVKVLKEGLARVVHDPPK